MKKSLSEILEILQSLTLGFESKYFKLPTLENPYTDDYITIIDNKYVYINIDMRGNKSIIANTDNLDEFIFEILKSNTHMAAFQFAAANPVLGKDVRELGFKKHIEILSSFNVNKDCLNKLRNEYAELLQQN